MSVANRITSSMARHWARLGAEPTEYEHPEGYRVRVDALWDAEEVVEVGQGFTATATTIRFAASAFVGPTGQALRPQVGAVVARYPDDVGGDRQTWQVAAEDADGRPVALADGYWRVPVERDLRPRGR